MNTNEPQIPPAHRATAQTYRCAHCAWEGRDPNLTDVSDLYPPEHERAGELAHTHRAVCPACGKRVLAIGPVQPLQHYDHSGSANAAWLREVDDLFVHELAVAASSLELESPPADIDIRVLPTMTVEQVSRLCHELSDGEHEVYCRIEHVNGQPVHYLVREPRNDQDVPAWLRRTA